MTGGWYTSGSAREGARGGGGGGGSGVGVAGASGAGGGAVTPASAQRTAAAPGPCMVQRETPGLRAARPGAARGAAGITGSGDGVPGKPVGKGKTGKSG